MKRLIVSMLIITSCANVPAPVGDCRATCNAYIAAQEQRYAVCERQVNECMEKLEKTSPDTFTKAIWGVAGLVLGLLVGARAVK